VRNGSRGPGIQYAIDGNADRTILQLLLRGAHATSPTHLMRAGRSTMAEAKTAIQRPLSPHLSVYRMMINMVMSMVHRLTGAALYFGTLLLAAWLIAAAMGEKQYAMVNALFGHPIGLLVLFGYSWALIHHMLGGVRHLIWDTGRGLGIAQANALAWTTIIGSVGLTIALWAYALRGAL
jgi:succinate dehydrogenase / fumarate reductase cytochrome b subunit